MSTPRKRVSRAGAAPGPFDETDVGSSRTNAVGRLVSDWPPGAAITPLVNTPASSSPRTVGSPRSTRTPRGTVSSAGAPIASATAAAAASALVDAAVAAAAGMAAPGLQFREDAVAAGGAVVYKERSIYDTWTERKRYFLLGLMSFATFLVPFSDTVYLPALTMMQKDLGTTQTLMAATIAVYMFCVGATALFWGPFADRWGRRKTLLISSGAFTALSFGCIFAPDVNVLVAFRALQGAAVSAMMVSANAVLADSWEPAHRGKAMGVFAIPTLVGPIVGPLLGGGLAQALGWRSTFASMAVCGGVIFLALLFFMEETHHHHVLKRIRTTEGSLAVMAIREHSFIQQPKFRAPWKPLKYLTEPEIFPHVMVTLLLYSSMLSALIILPNSLAHPPYSLSEALIGVANLPLGMGCLIVGPLGGRWADAGARRWSASPGGRIVPGLISAAIVFPLSMLGYAWSLHGPYNLAGPLICSFFMGASICAYFPGVMSYVSILKQHAAAAAGAAVQAVMFICGGVFIQITPPAMAAMGLGPWITLLVCLSLIATLSSAAVIHKSLKAAELEQLPTTAAGSQTDNAELIVEAMIVMGSARMLEDKQQQQQQTQQQQQQHQTQQQQLPQQQEQQQLQQHQQQQQQQHQEQRTS